jgi:excinuclease ABC subunit B
MQRAMAETERRRAKQIEHNKTHGIIAKGVSKRIKDIIDGVYDSGNAHREQLVAQQQATYSVMSEKQLTREIKRLEKEMTACARNLEFEKAASLRDELFRIKEQLFGAVKHDGTP